MKHAPINLFVLILGFLFINNLQAKHYTYSLVPLPTVYSGASYGYMIAFPPGYNENTIKYPLLVYLHGIGERGDGTTESLKVLLNTGIPEIIASNRFHLVNPHKMVVIAPQSNDKSRWNIKKIDQLIHFALDKYNVNSKRIYLVGNSYGAVGVFNYCTGIQNKNKVAAAVMICGCGNTDQNSINKMQNIPVWGFIGLDDPFLPYENITSFIDNIYFLKYGNNHLAQTKVDSNFLRDMKMNAKVIYQKIKGDKYAQHYQTRNIITTKRNYILNSPNDDVKITKFYASHNIWNYVFSYNPNTYSESEQFQTTPDSNLLETDIYTWLMKFQSLDK